jgi:hypothetical protein
MSTKYKATTTEEAFFITITTVGWVDVFTRLNQKGVIINALQHCQQNKGLEIYAYSIMSSHTRPLGYVQRSIARKCFPCPQSKSIKNLANCEVFLMLYSVIFIELIAEFSF